MPNLKSLSRALAVALAISGLVASAAQAQNSIVTPGAGATSYLGTQIGTHNIAAGTREMTCEKVEFTAAAAGNTETVSASAAYSECMTKPVLGVSFPVTITMNSCKFDIVGTPTTGSPLTYSAHMEIKCNAGDEIVTHVYKNSTHTEANSICTTTIKPQKAGGSFLLHNSSGVNPDDIVATTNLTLNVTIHGNLCGGGAETEKEFSLVYAGETTYRAFSSSGTQVNLTVSHL